MDQRLQEARKKKVFMLCLMLCLLLTFQISPIYGEDNDKTEYWDVLPTPTIEDEATRWTRIGAIGSCIGVGLSFFAVVVSLMAYNLPKKKKIKAEFGTAYGVSESEEYEFYTITVKNCGICPITVDDVHLRVGNNKMNILLWRAGKLSILHPESTPLPKKLGAADSLVLYLYRKKLELTINNYPNEGRNERLYIVVDDATGKEKYFRTKAWTNHFRAVSE